MVSWGAMRFGGVIVLDCVQKVREGIFCLVTAKEAGEEGEGGGSIGMTMTMESVSDPSLLYCGAVLKS